MAQETAIRDVVIIGAGAAGLICAIGAAQRGRSVLVLDHADRAAKKVRVSGGGRCNFTNLDVRAEHYQSANPHFCKSALARFTPQDFIAMVARHGVAFYEKEEGQLFCRTSAAEIVNLLLDECRQAGVVIRLRAHIKDIARRERFVITTDSDMIEAASLVVATGGLSYPDLGASDLGYRIARQFGLHIIPPKPGLVPLIFGPADRQRFKELSGVSFEATVACRKKSFRGQVLFTHRGLSGPAILQISSFRDKGDELILDLLPGEDITDILAARRTSKIELATLLAEHLPRSFVRIWCELNAPSRPMNSYSEKELARIGGMLHRWTVTPDGTEGYNKAEITTGGVDTAELSSKTMEATKIPGLFFAGEVMDVSGRLGGYNLQWAWSSGFAAGQYA